MLYIPYTRVIYVFLYVYIYVLRYISFYYIFSVYSVYLYSYLLNISDLAVNGTGKRGSKRKLSVYPFSFCSFSRLRSPRLQIVLVVYLHLSPKSSLYAIQLLHVARAADTFPVGQTVHYLAYPAGQILVVLIGHILAHLLADKFSGAHPFAQFRAIGLQRVGVSQVTAACLHVHSVPRHRQARI